MTGGMTQCGKGGSRFRKRKVMAARRSPGSEWRIAFCGRTDRAGAAPGGRRVREGRLSDHAENMRKNWALQGGAADGPGGTRNQGRPRKRLVVLLLFEKRRARGSCGLQARSEMRGGEPHGCQRGSEVVGGRRGPNRSMRKWIISNVRGEAQGGGLRPRASTSEGQSGINRASNVTDVEVMRPGSTGVRDGGQRAEMARMVS